MTASAVVVDRHDRVGVVFSQGTNHVGDTLLHFRVGALHGVELDGVGVLAGVHARNGTTAHTDAVVVATHQHHFLASLWSALDCVALIGEAHTTGKHNHFVVCQLAFCFLVLKCEERAADKRLAKLVAEVACAV